MVVQETDIRGTGLLQETYEDLVREQLELLGHDTNVDGLAETPARVEREYCQEDGPVMMDLIAEGNVGLMRAIKTFDETRGFKFITYAVWWIRQAMRKSLHAQHKAMRLPASHINDLQLVEKETAVLGQELGRHPTFEEIAERVELGPERLHNALEAGMSDMSLGAPVFEDEDTSVMAMFPAEDADVEGMEEEALMQTLRESLEVLSEREFLIVQSYFGLNGAETMTLEQIGQEMGVTRERVRQLRNRALEKMRAQYGDLLLELSAN